MSNNQNLELKQTLLELASLFEGVAENFSSLERIVSSMQITPNAVPEIVVQQEAPAVPVPKKRGRKPKQPAVAEHVPVVEAAPKPKEPTPFGTTDPALAEKIRNRYNPVARNAPSYSMVSHAGAKKRARSDASKHTTIEDE